MGIPEPHVDLLQRNPLSSCSHRYNPPSKTRPVAPLRSCPPFDYVIPLALPVPNPLIIFTHRFDSPAPGGPIPFTFHYELATIPTIEPAAFFSFFLLFCFSFSFLFRFVFLSLVSFFLSLFSCFACSFSLLLYFDSVRLVLCYLSSRGRPFTQVDLCVYLYMSRVYVCTYVCLRFA